jgi:beta-glucosidase
LSLAQTPLSREQRRPIGFGRRFFLRLKPGISSYDEKNNLMLWEGTTRMSHRDHLKTMGLAATLAAVLASCAGSPTATVAPPLLAQTAAPAATASSEAAIHPDLWPTAKSPIALDPKIETRVAGLLGKMTLDEKVGQVIQADIGSVTPEEVQKYHLGSILNGGNSAPGNDDHAPAQKWLALADAFWVASTDKRDGRIGIPAMWGTDAVHGHNNIIGATIFPHNIGLGAANDPDLMEAIGKITAREIRVTGLDWTFAPTIAVVRNDRWGRTYESYSEAPEIVRAYAPRLVYGLQGHPADADFLKGAHLMATVKHFVGDGGTTDGKDQGDNKMTETQLRDLQAAGYPAAVNAGVQSVMASYNSWHGQKMHGYKPMLTDVLRGRFGFDGLVVGDWNGHGQVKGCSTTSCAASLNAGLDMFMAPDSWKTLYANTLAQAKSGEISQARLDEAVARILRVKLRSGIFEAGLPSKRALAGQWALLGSKDHMAIARQAVRESLVLLKNNAVLPIKPGTSVIITGDGADNIAKQSGGWTISWQGTGNTPRDFPNGTSIYQGLKTAIEASGGSARLIGTSDAPGKADVAIVVFGEDPYAEFQGDRDHVDFEPTGPLQMLTRLKAAGIATVSVFLSGRPMWINPELNQSDAFVAAWLPGTAGDGIADVLVASKDGKPRYDFRGRLSFSWPKSAHDVELNIGDAHYDPQFAYGYGLSYASGATVGAVPEEASLAGAQKADLSRLMVAGVVQAPWSMQVGDAKGATTLASSIGVSPGGAVSVTAADHKAQEDVRLVRFAGAGNFALTIAPTDLEREANGDMAIRFSYRVDAASGSKLAFGGACGGASNCGGEIDMTSQFKARSGKGWQTATIKLTCLGKVGVFMGRLTSPFILTARGDFTIGLKEVALVSNTGEASCGL